LTDAARALVPEIGEVLALLEACQGALIARMSGSGATCFALFAAAAEARAAARRLKSEKSGWWVASGRLL
jgi:4-diphosphocytidyl-2-C-methyl-D-erythritol kinase